MFLRVLDQLGSDAMILYGSDYPHWQFAGEAPLPDWLPQGLRRKFSIDNPGSTYRRLKDG